MSEAESPKKVEKKRIIDVTDPDKAAPAPTSKPVLVSNRPILKDPMVTEDENKTDADAVPAKPELKRTSQPTIQPPERSEADNSDDHPKPAEPKEISATEEASKPVAAASAPAEKPAADPPAGPGPATETPAATPPSETRNPDFDPSTQDRGKPQTDAEKKLQAEAAERAKHDDMIQKLTEEGRYTLPIHSAEQQKTKQFIILGIILATVLVLAWLDIALDAGLIHLGGLHSVTHFFTN